MNSRITWIGAALVCALALAALLLRTSAPVPQIGSPDRPVTAHSGAASAPAPGAQANGAQTGSHTTRAANQPASAEPTANTSRKDSRVSAQERAFIAKLFEPPGPTATEQERQAWEQSSISGLVYPAGHPCAGSPLDSTSPAVLTAASKQNLAKLIDQIPDVDEPQCVYEGHWPFFPLNQACSGVNRDDPESVARCTNYLLSGGQDPAAYPATIWLPCSGGLQPTTRRAYFEDLISDQVSEIFSGPPCRPG